MKIHNVTQGELDWTLIRLGVVTASEVDALITPEGAARKGEGVTTYLYQKVAERVLGLTGSIPSSYSMEQGQILEKEAIPYLEFTYGWKIDRVGFVTADNPKCGASPDGLIGEDGGVEIKCPQLPKQVKNLMEGVIPKEYRAQVNFSLWVTGRKWWKFVSYNRHLPPLIVTVERNEEDMAAITKVITPFLAELDLQTNKLKRLVAEAHGVKENVA